MSTMQGTGAREPGRILWVAGGIAGGLCLLGVLAAIASVSTYALSVLLAGWAVVAIAAVKHSVRLSGRRPRFLRVLDRRGARQGFRREREP